MDRVEQTTISVAFSIAGTFALVFGAVTFLFLISTIFMVGGDGTAPGVTHLSIAIMNFSARIFGAPETSGVFSAVLLCSSIVFAAVFSSVLLFRMVFRTANNSNYAYSGYVFLIAFGLGMLLIHQIKVQQADRDSELKIVLDFVRNNPTVIQKVGIIDRVHTLSWSETKGQILSYTISVSGKLDRSFQDIYAVVDVSRGTGKPNYNLRCTGYFEQPCKVNAE